jgi:hypothetical protein
MKIKTINVVEVINFSVVITAFTNDSNGKIEAQELFLKLIHENNAEVSTRDLSRSELESALDCKRWSDDDGYEVLLTESN